MKEKTMENETGSIQIFVTKAQTLQPVEKAHVELFAEEDLSTPFADYYTNESGQTPFLSLPAPSVSLTQSPSQEIPYGTVTIRVTAKGYTTTTVTGCELLSGIKSLQPLSLYPGESGTETLIRIPEHTLYGDYPPKLPESEIKPVPETGQIVLSNVVVPEYMIVHDGAPSDKSAKNYWVRYRDYIKNVACSEIYPTWPEAAIYANIIAIMSFSLNRVYTEWYTGKGYDFTITSSTAYDQKWIYGRTIFANIDYLVDSIFANYLSKPGVVQPLFTSYCDGKRVSCKGLSQWGSKYLADDGYSAIEILRYYYGNDVFLNTAPVIAGVPSSYPGYKLAAGSRGTSVVQLQRQLSRIGESYPAIGRLAIDGIFGLNTEAAVKTFQKVFNIPSTGIVDYATWYAISNVYVAVTRISEPF